MKIFYTLVISSMFSLLVQAEMNAISDNELDSITGQSGITINAKVNLGDKTRFVYTNTLGKTKETAGSDASYLIADKISGSVEIKGLKLDLISDLDRSGKSALQWTLPEKVVAEEFKIGGIYASTSEAVDPSGVSSSFLVGVSIDGTLSLPASTTVSVFVVE